MQITKSTNNLPVSLISVFDIHLMEMQRSPIQGVLRWCKSYLRAVSPHVWWMSSSAQSNHGSGCALFVYQPETFPQIKGKLTFQRQSFDFRFTSLLLVLCTMCWWPSLHTLHSAEYILFLFGSFSPFWLLGNSNTAKAAIACVYSLAAVYEKT